MEEEKLRTIARRNLFKAVMALNEDLEELKAQLKNKKRGKK